MNEPTFINGHSFLHHINTKNLTHLMNFLPGGGGYASPASLDIAFLVEVGADFQRIETVKKQKLFYTLSERDLLEGLKGFEGIAQSYRMESLITASKFRNGVRIGKADMTSFNPKLMNDGWVDMGYELIWSDEVENKEKQILDLSEVEIAFELARREYAPDAPSRITCLYMVENNFDGQMLLQRMFNKRPSVSYQPMLLNLGIVCEEKYAKVDSSFYLKYIQDRQKKFLEQYWLGECTDNPDYEILFEGMVGLRDQHQKDILSNSLHSMTRACVGQT